MADPQQDREPRRSYYTRNPWRPWVAGAFAGASVMLTVTTLFYALGRLPLALVAISVLLAIVAFGFGLYARYRAACFDAGIGER
jgi:formate/nitrite transporter FocA (FNT family)